MPSWSFSIACGPGQNKTRLKEEAICFPLCRIFFLIFLHPFSRSYCSSLPLFSLFFFLFYWRLVFLPGFRTGKCKNFSRDALLGLFWVPCGPGQNKTGSKGVEIDFPLCWTFFLIFLQPFSRSYCCAFLLFCTVLSVFSFLFFWRIIFLPGLKPGNCRNLSYQREVSF